MKHLSLILNCLSIFLSFTFFLSSCGFGGRSGDTTFRQASAGNPGDGATPQLSQRISIDPNLSDLDCEDNKRCEETCRSIYNHANSSTECQDLTIGEVASIENVFYALLDGDEDTLREIEPEDLSNYLEIGLDGWRDKIISQQKTKENREKRIKNTLRWAVDRKRTIISILEREDPKSEILEQIFGAHCNLNDSINECETKSDRLISLDSTSDADLMAFCPNPTSREQALEYHKSLGIYYNTGEVYECTCEVYPSLSCEFSVLNSLKAENRSLFLALISVLEDFFFYSILEKSYDAFVLGHNIVEKVCANINSSQQAKCVSTTYCQFITSRSVVDQGFRAGGADALRYLQDFLNVNAVVEGVGSAINVNQCAL